MIWQQHHEWLYSSQIAFGGGSTFENLCLACPTCNRRKASRQSGIDSITGDCVMLFHPQNDVWSDHFSWNKTATEIIPLTPTGEITIDFLQMNRHQITVAREMWADVGKHPPK